MWEKGPRVQGPRGDDRILSLDRGRPSWVGRAVVLQGAGFGGRELGRTASLCITLMTACASAVTAGSTV